MSADAHLGPSAGAPASGAGTANAAGGAGIVLMTLAAGQFVMALDTTVMNTAVATVAKALSALRSFEMNTAARTVWAGAGLTAGAFTVAAGRHGLATGFGDTGSVGIGGITLAGGVGFLVRKHGLTIDNLLAAEIVTADGRVRRVDADNEPELFWALRGGGGNFGVVTRFQYRLHPVDTVLGGLLILPATPDVIAGFVGSDEFFGSHVQT